MNDLPGLTTKKLGRHFIHLPLVDSTNNYVKENALLLQDGAAVIADEQSGGRGRLGREWVSRPGAGLYLSVYLEQMPKDWLTRLPLVTALAVREGLKNLCGVELGIKWSNDLLAYNKKVCGILCESRIYPNTISGVIGIGVNLLQDERDFLGYGVLYASSLLLATNRVFLPPQAAAAICNSLEPALTRLEQEGFLPLLCEYKKLCVTLGRKVRFSREGAPLIGEAVDIAEDGSLVCEVNGKRHAVSSGEAAEINNI
ncbi:MAG: biotin--[acetyl-CoA-carboxylase] ligase [Oscillospiraceae bacterium]|nr:biotin--[acetyl-CoA-carboxylase] ligase [Oscillospiraceae bacterium]